MDKLAQKYDLSHSDLGELCAAFVAALAADKPRLLAELEAFAREHALKVLGREIFADDDCAKCGHPAAEHKPGARMGGCYYPGCACTKQGAGPPRT